MTDKNNNVAFDSELQRLEQRIEELLASIEHLREENRALRLRQENLSGERALLVQKNEQARAKVEAIISRLRTLETGT
jgi:cell division protein ZapB